MTKVTNVVVDIQRSILNIQEVVLILAMPDQDPYEYVRLHNVIKI